MCARVAIPVRGASRSTRNRTGPRVEHLERRDLMTASNLFIPSPVFYPPQDLVQAPIITSRNGSLDATLNMVSAGFTSDPILYGGQPILSSPADPNSPNNPNKPVYAMAYQVDAYGTTYPAGYPGPTLQLQTGDTLNLHVIDNLADPSTPPNVVFDTNLHTHGLHVSDLGNGDNVYRQISPGQSMNVSIPIPSSQPDGVNWYHVHRHMSTHDQVYGGLSGLLLIGDPLDPWPQYKGKIQEVNMGITEVNIQNGHLTNYNAGTTGANFTNGWQKRINGQENPIIHIRPGETQVWNLGSIGAFGAANIAITDGNLLNPWNGTLLVQDGNGQNIRPYALSLAADPERMQDLAAATLIMPGNRLTLAVTAPTTPGTYYLIDGWGGQDKPAVNAAGQQQFYVLATIQVDGPAVPDPPPVFAPVGPVDPLFYATPDVQRTYEFTINPGATPAQNQFLINGKTFGNGVMPQVQIGSVEEWTLTNPINPNANANHPFHIHQGNFIVTAVNGVPVDPNVAPPAADSSVAYISPRDVIDIPSGGSITIRFRAEDFPGKYVFHCHILKHEDQGMMSPVLQFGPAEGLRMGFGTLYSRESAAIVMDGKGEVLGEIHPFGRTYHGPVVTASGLATSEFYQTLAVGTGTDLGAIRVYKDGTIKPGNSFRAFRGPGGHGVSLAVGDLSGDGSADIAAGARGAGPARVRLFDTDGKLLREFNNVLPGRFPHGVNVAIGDVNGDNFDDLVISAGRGREPLVTALDGQDIANGAPNPKRLFTFVAGGGPRAGARIAVGYVAPASVPSYLANIVTTPETGRDTGVIEVWNAHDVGADVSHGTMETMPPTGMSMEHGSKSRVKSAADHGAPTPMVTFRPFGRIRHGLQILTNYLSQLGKPGVPVIASWQTPHKVAFSSISLDNTVTTEVRDLE